MFTGIIQHVGSVAAIKQNQGGTRLSIAAGQWAYSPAAGDSIAVNGCCLTYCQGDQSTPAAGDLHFDVIAQTLKLTTLGDLAVGDRVNLEHAVTPHGLLGGHIVQGHVDGVATVAAVTDTADERRLRIEPPPSLHESIIERGSIAVDGVSLTVAAVTDSAFEVALIPTTLRDTTLSDRSEGDRVNIETDYIARTVTHWLQRQHDKR